MTLAEIRRLYVFDFKSTAEIARQAGRAKRTINSALRAMGVELRAKTSLRNCRLCGQPTFKILVHNGTSRVLSGGLCRKHQIERWREKNRRRREAARNHSGL